MFISQPEQSFGHYICRELVSEESGQYRWHTAEFAVAWLNYSGGSKIWPVLQEFLSFGGRVRITVGLDFGSTTHEGLSGLLQLEQEGDLATHVFFDENPACTFHPKIFLFSNDAEARLLVGSNNLTGAGLQTNVEAALAFFGALNDEVIQSARHALAAWRDDGRDSRTRRLTQDLLEQLRNQRYVLTESEIRTHRAENGPTAARASPLFGRSSTRPLRPGRRAEGPAGDVGRTTGSALGEVLLMRVKPRRNGNQVQISMKILDASFMNGAKEVVAIDGSVRPIGYNKARGVPNTARFEAPEMKGMRTPVARFQWVYRDGPNREPTKVLQYEIFDAENSIEGGTIFKKLDDGIAASPLTKLEELSQEETVLSTKNRERAQWYRLDSS